MGAIVFGTSDVNVNIAGHYDRNLLERALPSWVFGKFGQQRPLQQKSGDQITFRRIESLAPATTALTPGVTPTGKRPAITDISTRVLGYGDFIQYDDFFDMVNLDNNVVEFTDLLGEQMGDTLDILCRDPLLTGTNVRYANDVAARANVATAVSADDLDSIIRTLERGNTKKIRRVQGGGPGVGTRPLPPAFIGITHVDMRKDLEALSDWKPVEEYASLKDALNDPENGLIEAGAYKGIRFILTTNAKIWEADGVAVGTTGLVAANSTNIDVYGTLIFGDNAYGHVPLTKSSMKAIIKQLGSGGTGDPLNQKASVGWKTYYKSLILNDDFIVRLETGATDM